ncbi:extracellular serine-rich protein [Stagonosporopsis vannaccii]|nr:extracellular serine-rich protein [Stagonosporopsis vannaccii]
MKSISFLLTLAATVSALPKLKPHRRANQIIPVVVGGPQDTFVPNSVVAAVGDIVQFQFSNGNHTVTQSTVDQACTPMEAGVHSGHIPFQDGQTEVGTFNMPVTSTDPMFLYCATGPHCQNGQVMVINPANAQQVADYAKLSQATEKSTDGGDPVGGAAGKIALDQAAFTPAPPEEGAGGAPPPADAPPAEAPPAEAPPAEAPAAGNATAPAETTAAEGAAPPMETPSAEAPPAEASAETSAAGGEAAASPSPTSFVFRA